MKKNILILAVFLIVLLTLRALFFQAVPTVESNKPKTVQKEPLKIIGGKSNADDGEKVHKNAEVDGKGHPEAQKLKANVVKINLRDLQENLEEDKSEFSKTYKLLTELELTKKGSVFKIELDKSTDEAMSLVFVGGKGDGESGVSEVLINGEVSSSNKNSLEDSYYEDDWKKLSLSGKKFKSVTFYGKALQGTSTIKVYLQHQGEME